MEHNQEQLERVAMLAGSASPEIQSELQEVGVELEALDAETDDEVRDPEEAKRLTEASRRIRGRLARIEAQVAEAAPATEGSAASEALEDVEEIVDSFGSQLEKEELRLLRRDATEAAERHDGRGLDRVAESASRLKYRVLMAQDWWWEGVFKRLSRSPSAYLNPEQARVCVTNGERAVAAGDGEGLRDAVRGLWRLQPQSEAEASREQGLAAGIRRY